MKKITKYLLIGILISLTFSCAKDGVDGLDGLNGTNGTDGINGQDGADGQNASGKTYIYITGNVTDAEAATIIQNDFGSITQFIYIRNTSQLTTVDLTGISELVNLNIYNNSALTTLTIPDLTTVYETIYYQNNPLLNNFNLPNLINCQKIEIQDQGYLQSLDLSKLEIAGSINIYNTLLTTINIPLLYEVNEFSFYVNQNLTSINLPELLTIGQGGFTQIDSNPLLTAINAPKLATLKTISITDNNSLINFDLPLLTQGNLSVEGNPSLTSINVPILKTFDSFYFYNNAIPSTRVNSYLNQFVTISPSITGKSIYIYGQTPIAPPTGQGVTDKNTLIANGNQVNTD
ncbi:leucine-rich repeat protein [Lutibacter sp.]|uniref:leucine-rich repeat protein n=1 Tax=Lutibacter sp. TaxID=1925666 RepID=UPI0025BF4306|nr:leucine-rich repeat protein [Lutibacter sp.]MCF6168275.1 hypothetical protein [Lutibacter sp.]